MMPPGAATPASNHAAGFDYLLSQTPSQAHPTPYGNALHLFDLRLNLAVHACSLSLLVVAAGVGQWGGGGFDVLPLHMPALADQGRGAAATMPPAAHTHRPSLAHVHGACQLSQQQQIAKPLTFEVPASDTANDNMKVKHGTCRNQLNRDSESSQPQLPHEPGAPSGACPPVQFGVFTNLVSGSNFTARNLSAAAQHNMRSFACEDAVPAVLGHNADARHSAQPAGQQAMDRCMAEPMGRQAGLPIGKPTGLPIGRPTEQTAGDADGAPQSEGSCPKVQFGVFTNLKTGGSFAVPGSLSDAAQQRVKDIFCEDPVKLGAPAHGRALPGSDPQPYDAAELDAADIGRQGSQGTSGACPQVQPGAFINLKTGEGFVAPGKMTAAAQEKASMVLRENLMDPEPPAQCVSLQCQLQPVGLPEGAGTDVSNPASTDAAGSHPQIRTGMFTHLEKGTTSAACGMLSDTAQQRARDLLSQQACGSGEGAQTGGSQVGADATQPADQQQHSTTQLPASPDQPLCVTQLPQNSDMPKVPAEANEGGLAVTVASQETEATQQAAQDQTPPQSAAAASAQAQAEVTPAQGLNPQAVATMTAASPVVSPTPCEASAGGSAELQVRQSGSKWRRSQTMLSRLSKLAKSSPGISPAQHAPAQHAQHGPAVPAVEEGAPKSDQAADVNRPAAGPAKQRAQPQQQEDCAAGKMSQEDVVRAQMLASRGEEVREQASGLVAAKTPGRSA